jgi:general nucleoside transport system ATP-binding protein
MQIQLETINKHFGAVHANRDITLSLNEGKIIGILGENGAGKSTLMKILSGYQAADSGTIFIDGKAANYHGPQAAIAVGIGMLQQDPLDIGAFTVLENFCFGKPVTSLFERIFDNRASAKEQLDSLCRQFGFELDASQWIEDLSIAQRQQLEILRLLALGVRCLILDEPTTGISAEQKDILFKTLREMAQAGMTVLLVSHKLEDVIALCDEVAILRQGAVVGTKTMPLSKTELVKMMFGDDLPSIQREHHDHSTEPVILELRDLRLHEGRLTIQTKSFSVRRGEIIGLAGLDGSGQELIMRTAAGLIRPQAGQILVFGHDLAGADYHTMRARGIVFGAAGRVEEGLIAGLTLTEHVALTEGKGFLMDWQAAKASTAAKISHYRVKGQPDDTIESLSGGNQQRILMALLPELPTVMILEQPMRGLDVDSAAWIWEQLLERCDAGSALLFSSPDLDELLSYSDRILVCYAGHLHMVDDIRNLTSNQLGHLIGGEFDSSL